MSAGGHRPHITSHVTVFELFDEDFTASSSYLQSDQLVHNLPVIDRYQRGNILDSELNQLLGHIGR